MTHLLLTTGFGLGIDQTSLTLHKDCFGAFAILVVCAARYFYVSARGWAYK